MPMPSSASPEEAGAVLQTIIDNLPSAVTYFDSELRMVACNKQLPVLLDFPASLFENGLPSLFDLALFNARRGEYGPGDPQAHAHAVCERARTMQPHVFERVRPDGTVLEVRGSPLPDGGFITIYTDISERKRAELEALRYASYVAAVIDALPQGVTVIDEQLTLVLWNRGFEQVLDLPQGWMKPGVTFGDVVRFNARRGEYGDVDVDAKVRETVELARRFLPHRLRRQRPDGRTLEVEGRPVTRDGQTLGFVTTYTDITELSNARHAAELRAHQDALTGLANRARFIERFAELQADAVHHPLCLVLVDIDHFKAVNDRHGHLAGDACLKAVARALLSHVRKSDLVARFGGEEFVILLPGANLKTAIRAAEGLRLAVAGASTWPGVALTASFGVTEVRPEEPSSLEQAVGRADAALYAAKDRGRNRVEHQPG